jgi:carboxyl-terminal processing protease
MARPPPVPRVALAAALLALSPLLGCPGQKAADCSPTATRANVLATARAWYLFADQVPDFNAFDPADPSLSAQQFLDAIVAAAGAPDAGRGFSYLSTKEASSQFFDEGTSLGYGIGLRFEGTTQLFVTQVFGDAATPPGSPAARAGLARGDELLAIAPTQAGLDDAASQVADLLARNALTAAFSSGVAGTTRWFRVRHAGATAPVDLTATTAIYSLDPLPRAAAPIVLEVPAGQSDTGALKKVGYLHLRTFIGPAAALLRQAFADLKDRKVTDLIVDLRYDGGGRLDVAGLFVDLMSAGRPGPKFGLRHNPFRVAEDFDWPSSAEAGAIAPARVAFILTGSSASASELLPFALAADLGADVAVVGEASYGKPVGQYGFSSPDCPELLYLLSFQLASGGVRAQYFGGLPDAAWAGASCAAGDDLAHTMGDPAEVMTAAALGWIADRSCAGGAIPPTSSAARLARRLASPLEAPEPTLAQRHVPGLF